MRVADMHCDTISAIHNSIEKGKPCSLASNELHIDVDKLKRGDYLIQNFAMFIHRDKSESPMDDCLQMIDVFYNQLEENRQDMALALCYSDILENRKQNKISALLTIEEGGVCEGKLWALRNFHRLGVRMMTLTWNFENELAFPNASKGTKVGLKELGYRFVCEMERLHMLVDVSHLSDAGFYDVYSCTKQPFVASHSNARALCNHPRNLTDDMIRKLASRGGVAGINLYGPFLEQTRRKGIVYDSTIEAAVQHIKHMAQVGGVACVGLGTDYDGIDGNLELKDCSCLPLLADALKSAGFHESEIEKIFYQTVLRVYREVLTA